MKIQGWGISSPHLGDPGPSPALRSLYLRIEQNSPSQPQGCLAGKEDQNSLEPPYALNDFVKSFLSEITNRGGTICNN